MDYKTKQKELIAIDATILELSKSKAVIQEKMLKASLQEAFKLFPILEKLWITSDSDSLELYAVTDEHKVLLDDSAMLGILAEDYEGEDLSEENINLFQQIFLTLSQGGWDDINEAVGSVFHIDMADFGNYYNFTGEITRKKLMASNEMFVIDILEQGTDSDTED